MRSTWSSVFAKRDIAFEPQGAKRVYPADNCGSKSATARLSTTIIWLLPPGQIWRSTKWKGLGRRNSLSICHVDHALQAYDSFKQLVAKPGPVIIGAAQGALMLWPAYEFTFVLDKALRDAKVRDRVPMTFVTAEPYIGHLGLDGVGDTKGLLESEMRQHHVKSITNAKVKKVEPVPDDGR